MQLKLWHIWHTDLDGSTRIAEFFGAASQALSVARTLRMLGCEKVHVLGADPPARDGQAAEAGPQTEGLPSEKTPAGLTGAAPVSSG